MCTLKVHPPPTPTHASQHRAHLDIGRDVQRHLSKEGEHEHAQPEDKEEEEKVPAVPVKPVAGGQGRGGRGSVMAYAYAYACACECEGQRDLRRIMPSPKAEPLTACQIAPHQS